MIEISVFKKIAVIFPPQRRAGLTKVLAPAAAKTATQLFPCLPNFWDIQEKEVMFIHIQNIG